MPTFKPALLLALRAYQLGISPFLGQNCRFYPSCSEYARQAIELHGAARGTLLAARRLCRCHPWHAGGCDPVPAPATARPAVDVAAAGATNFTPPVPPSKAVAALPEFDH
jgi:putative membrane protein insertion efficiency factor